MALIDLPLPAGKEAGVPGDVRAFLREADRRIRRFVRQRFIAAFVPSDFETAYTTLRALDAASLAPSNLFCEWGSGFGVVACLAAMLGFDACGIEIEQELVDAAQQLADDFGLPVEFVQGSFIPRGAEAAVEACDGFVWLTTDGADTHKELGLGVDDFGVIFAYPWPDEERVTDELFERYAGAGAVLVTHHGGESFQVRRQRRATPKKSTF